MKERLDILLTERGFFSSREKAKTSIMAGIVTVDGTVCDKPGTKIDTEAEIAVKEAACPYVSRGGLKLEKAIEVFGIDLSGANAADIGASTGGFTDCMLQNGASHVTCIDVGYGQLDWKLRNDPRITNMEKTNVRYLDTEAMGQNMDFISIDVSFISLKLVLPVAEKLLKEDGCAVALVKPQFEAGRSQVGKKGIVRDPAVHLDVLRRVQDFAAECGMFPAGLDYSPVTGTGGNIEYLLFMKKKLCDNVIDAEEVVKRSHEALKK